MVGSYRDTHTLGPPPHRASFVAAIVAVLSEPYGRFCAVAPQQLRLCPGVTEVTGIVFPANSSFQGLQIRVYNDLGGPAGDYCRRRAPAASGRRRRAGRDDTAASAVDPSQSNPQRRFHLISPKPAGNTISGSEARRERSGCSCRRRPPSSPRGSEDAAGLRVLMTRNYEVQSSLDRFLFR